jgi:hypothetical protein
LELKERLAGRCGLRWRLGPSGEVEGVVWHCTGSVEKARDNSPAQLQF